MFPLPIYIPTLEQIRGMREAKEAHEKALFEAWQLVNPQHSALTLQQWRMLRDAEMLPGVDYAKIRSDAALKAANAAKEASDKAKDAADAASRKASFSNWYPPLL